MFTPNEQNLAGLENVCRDIRSEETEGLKKSIRLHFVAANVPDLDDEKRILRRQIQAFRARLGFTNLSGVIRRYESLHLLDQSIFVIDHPHSRLARAYRQLLPKLLMDNLADRDGAMLFLENPPFDPFSDVDQSKKMKRFHEIARHFNEDVEILMEVAERFERERDYRSAVSTLDRVIQLEPKSAGLDEKQIREIQALRERLHALALLPGDSSLAPSGAAPEQP